MQDVWQSLGRNTHNCGSFVSWFCGFGWSDLAVLSSTLISEEYIMPGVEHGTK